MRRKTLTPEAERRGVILLVVIALLTLFAIVGVTFVLYSTAESASARAYREAVAPPQPDMDPQLLLNYFLSQLIYDVSDTAGLYSAMRGHSLARSMYGYYTTDTATNTTNVANTTAFNGTGRLHTGTGSYQNPYTMDDYSLINYMYFAGDTFVRDPEKYSPTVRTDTTTPPGKYTGGFNPPYTYPDLNNMYLGLYRADGTVLTPSFHRHWLFNYQYALTDSINNPNWNNQVGKYMILRPRPFDMDTSTFPYPEDAGGDVKNLVGFPPYQITDGGGNVHPANNDSIWMDLGAPVMTAPDGTKFKPLFAPFVAALDNRMNLNVAGNIRGLASGNPTHASNQGWGPWEQNLAYALYADTQSANPEWTSIFIGTTPTTMLGTDVIAGRYGWGGTTPGVNGSIATPGSAAHFYSQADFDGVNELNGFVPSTPWALATTVQYTLFPNYQVGGTSGWDSGSTAERTNHPLLYNFYSPTNVGSYLNNGHAFDIWNMEAMLRYGGNGSPGLTSDLFRLCPLNFGDASAPLASFRRRNLVTTHSFDVDVGGITPYVFDNAGPIYVLGSTTRYTLTTTVPTPPAGPLLSFPDLATRIGGSPPAPYTTDNGEFRQVDWRALSPLLKRVDLNRKLTDYPAPTLSPGYIDATDPHYIQAVSDRQVLASDVFKALKAVTIGPSPYSTATPSNDTLRWLAQMSVNIVDFIDNDDYMTPFYWQNDTGGYISGSSSEVVFGTELPRLVINEAYSEITNDPADPGIYLPSPKANWYNVKSWVELYNPFATDFTLQDTGRALLQLDVNATTPPIYQLAICESPLSTVSPVPSIRSTPNSYGDLDTPNVKTLVASWAADPAFTPTVSDFNVVYPSDGTYGGTPANFGANVGYSLLGTTAVFPWDPSKPTTPQTIPRPKVTIAPAYLPVGTTTGYGMVTTWESSLSYNLPASTTNLPGPTQPTPVHAFVLRRLACPHLPPDSNPASVTYNPYVTVDYMDFVPIMDGVRYDYSGVGTVRPQYTDTTLRYSFARPEPYAADYLQMRYYLPPTYQPVSTTGGSPTNTDQPQHTFFRHNAREQIPPADPTDPNQTARLPANWLVHLDRILINPMELMHVSAYRPHELTQQFMVQQPGGGSFLPYAHRIPWFDQDLPPNSGQSHRFSRVLELLETRNLPKGSPVGGRLAGKVNLNLVWDEETFLGLVDPQPSNNFTNAFTIPSYTFGGTAPYKLFDTMNPTLFQQLLKLRTPGYTPGANDRPFWGMAPPYSPPGAVYADTIGPEFSFFRSLDTVNFPAGSPRLFEVPPDPTLAQGAHPYMASELMTKLFNNVTTRSNVFAVWVTVGFFRVADDTVLPVKLGEEIGRSENRQIRHQMFAIIDRTNLSMIANSTNVGPRPFYFTIDTDYAVGSQPTISLGMIDTLGPHGAIYDGRAIDLPPSPATASLLFDPGPNQETISVSYTPWDTSTAPATSSIALQSTFAYAHSAGFTVTNIGGDYGSGTILLGNPGPQPHFDVRNNPGVVRYFSIIK